MVHLYTTFSPGTRSSGHAEIKLQNQNTSQSSSGLHPRYGIEYNHNNYSVVLQIADGSLHIIGDFGGVQKHVNSVKLGLSSRRLSALMRNFPGRQD